MKKSIFYFATLTLLLTACSGDADKDATTQEDVAIKTCTYNYDASSSKLEWIAYKTTEKVAVKGTFNTIKMSETVASQKPLDVLRNASFEIPIATVNSSNPERDKKISTSFFGAMINTMKIVGEIKFLDNMEVRMNVKLNDVIREITGSYSISETGYFTMDASLDLANFKAEDAVKSLNTVCGELHKGPDGISKLWNEVTLRFETALKKTCE